MHARKARLLDRHGPKRRLGLVLPKGGAAQTEKKQAGPEDKQAGPDVSPQRGANALRGQRAVIVDFMPPRGVNSPTTSSHTGLQALAMSSQMRLTPFS